MKVRQSASLVAGVCTLCVAASGSITPLPTAAAAATPVAPVSRAFELTADSQELLTDLANVAGLPVNNLITALNAISAGAGGVGGAASLQSLPNLLFAQAVAGTLTQASATTAINAALANEKIGLTTFANAPATIINHDIAVISTLLADLGLGPIGIGAAATAKTDALTADVATADAGDNLTNLANVLGLPVNNLITALNAISAGAGGVGGAASLQSLPNLLFAQAVAGTLTQASATTAINAALANEKIGLTTLANAPATIINHDVAVITAFFDGLGASSLSAASISTTPAIESKTITTNALPADTGDITTDFANVAGLPVNNLITALNAISAGAGGVGGAASLQSLPNLLFAQAVAGTLTQASATTAFNAAVANEKIGLTTLANAPATIINHDVAVISKLVGDFGGGGAVSSGLAKGTALAPAAKKAPGITANALAGPGTDDGTPVGSATVTRHAKKADDNNPLAHAIKAITKGSYVGKHRADDAKASAAKGDDGSTGDGSKSSKESKHVKSK